MKQLGILLISSILPFALFGQVKKVVGTKQVDSIDIIQLTKSTATSGQLLQFNGTSWTAFTPGYLTATNLALGTTTTTTQPITNTGGTGFTLPSATTSLAGLMSSTDKTNLGNAILKGGNTFGSPVSIGTNDAMAFNMMSNGGVIGTFTSSNSQAGYFQVSKAPASGGDFTSLGVSPNPSGSSGKGSMISILPTISQTGTAGYRGLWISPFENTLGSGIHYLISAGTNSASLGGGTDAIKFLVDNVGNTSILGNTIIGSTSLAATHTLTLANTATETSYNTTDQTTNYERVSKSWASNSYNIVSESGGTGTKRNIKIGDGKDSLVIGKTPTFKANAGIDIQQDTANHTVVNIGGYFGKNSSGFTQYYTSRGLSITPTVNQPDSVSTYDALFIAPYEQASSLFGNKNLINAGTLSGIPTSGGTTFTSKFSVGSSGNVTSQGQIAATGLIFAGTYFQSATGFKSNVYSTSNDILLGDGTSLNKLSKQDTGVSYTKHQIDSITAVTNTNIGNSNLTTTGGRLLTTGNNLFDINGNTGSILVDTATGIRIATGNGKPISIIGNGLTAKIYTDSMTADRNIRMPNADGTLALKGYVDSVVSVPKNLVNGLSYYNDSIGLGGTINRNTNVNYTITSGGNTGQFSILPNLGVITMANLDTGFKYQNSISINSSGAIMASNHFSPTTSCFVSTYSAPSKIVLNVSGGAPPNNLNQLTMDTSGNGLMYIYEPSSPLPTSLVTKRYVDSESAATVPLSRIASMPTNSLIYRKTAGAGAPEVNTIATLKTDLGLTGTNSGDITLTTIGTSDSATLVGTTLNIPARKRIDNYTVTTNGSGVGAVTYGTAFPATPNIQGTIVGTSTGHAYLLTVTSNITTGFSVTVQELTAALGNFVFTAVSGVKVNITVFEN